MSKKDMRDFESVVRGIVRAEEDVDRVLRAAKLQRRPRSEFWEGTDFPQIILGIVMVMGVGGLFALIFLSVLLGR